MKITINKREFMDGINRALKAVPSKTTMQILESFLLEAKGNSIILTGNDMELGICTHMYGMVLEDGIIALNARMLKDIVSKMPNSDILLETDGNMKATVKCEKCLLHIQGNTPDHFPPIQDVKSSQEFELEQGTLKDMIRNTIFSISKDDSIQQMMKSVNLLVNNGQLKLTALDGHRIAIRYVKSELSNNVEVNIPGKTLREVEKILENEGTVQVSVGKNHVVFRTENTTVTSRIVNGNYYQVDKMMNGDWTTCITVDRLTLISSIDRATLFTRTEERRPVKFCITDHEMVIQGDGLFGSLKEEIAVEKEGRDLTIAFNPFYLLECLKIIEDEKVTIRMVNPKAPALIVNEESGYIYLILPVNIHSR